MRSAFDSSVAAKLVQEGWPLLLAAVAVTIYMKSDLMMLGLISGDEETGIYSAAARLSELWYFVPVAVTAATGPRLAALYGRGEFDRYVVATQRLMTALVAGSIVVLVLTALLAGPIIGMLYGDPYANAVPVLQIHAVSGPFVFVGLGASQTFVDRRMTRAVFLRSATGAGINVGLNLVLIPSYGAIGASIATLLAYALSGMALNLIRSSTRPIAVLQLKAFAFAWPRWPS
jgi:PST family polysaccharide transporter